MRPTCSRCGGFVVRTPGEGEATCWNCGRIFYDRAPITDVAPPHRRSMSPTVDRVVQALVAFMMDNPAPVHSTTLYLDVVSGMVPWSHHQTRALLSRREEFTHVGGGRWELVKR